MEFLSDNIGDKLLESLRKSTEVFAAVAYFSPDQEILETLKSIPKLRLTISDDFIINNPYHLLELALKKHEIKVFNSGNIAKLHSKVFIGKLQNGKWWGMIGSANLTYGGLFSNKEACIWLNESYSDTIKRIKSWMDNLHEHAENQDWSLAKSIYDQHKSILPKIKGIKHHKFWVIKCRSGSKGVNYWQKFLSEKVVAIGWHDIKTNPNHLNETELIKELKHHYRYNSTKAVKQDIATIRQFSQGIQKGDKVIICNGYPAKSTANVYVYALAEIDGTFTYDEVSTWWKMKIPVKMHLIERYIPKHLIVNAINKESLMKTMHHIDSATYDRFREVINNEN